MTESPWISPPLRSERMRVDSPSQPVSCFPFEPETTTVKALSEDSKIFASLGLKRLGENQNWQGRVGDWDVSFELDCMSALELRPSRISGCTQRLSQLSLSRINCVECAVVDSEKLPCGGSSSITQADCEASNCCYDSSSSTSPCYYANDGEWFWVSEQRWQLLDIHACLLCPVTVQCTLDGQFVVVVSEKVTLPSLDLGSIQLVDSSSPSCSPVTSLSSFVLYQFPVSACGSTVQLSGGNVTYQNTMSAAITVRSGPEGSITRDSVYKLFFQCTYSGSQDVQVEAEVYTVVPPLPVVEQGPFDLELVIATDSSYGSYYVDADYPVTKTLRDPVAVEVHIVNRTDPNLVLTLGDCWVTPGPSASSQPQWSLLVNGCPYAGDNYLTSLVTVDSTSGVAYPSHYKRFVFEMFAFVDPVARQALAEKAPKVGDATAWSTKIDVAGRRYYCRNSTAGIECRCFSCDQPEHLAWECCLLLSPSMDIGLAQVRGSQDSHKMMTKENSKVSVKLAGHKVLALLDIGSDLRVVHHGFLQQAPYTNMDWGNIHCVHRTVKMYETILLPLKFNGQSLKVWTTDKQLTQAEIAYLLPRQPQVHGIKEATTRLQPRSVMHLLPDG
ncbi:ZP4 protein, partial [Polypterus senegalus]